jgi:hypothetical protein
MKDGTQKKSGFRVFWIVCGFCAATFLVWLGFSGSQALLGFPGSRTINSPVTGQMSAMREISLKLLRFDDDHPNLKPEDIIKMSIDDYVAMGVLIPEDAAYVRDHNITFHGFDPGNQAADLPLFEAVYTKTRKPIRIIVYRDFHVGFLYLKQSQ